jgi:hypothetical protein
MLSLKIQNVSNILEALAEKTPSQETKQLLTACTTVLEDAAEQAMAFETAPVFIGVDWTKESKEARP